MATLDKSSERDELMTDESSLAKKKKSAQKAHDNKTAMNDKQFAEICYTVFIEKLQIHYHTIQLIKQHLISLDDFQKSRLRADIAEKEFAKSMSEYNESYKDKSSANTSQQTIDSQQLDNLIKSIAEAIAKLREQINFLNAKIAETETKIATINKDLSDEIKKLFVTNNPDLKVAHHTFAVKLPHAYSNITGANRFQPTFSADKDYQIEMAQIFASELDANNVSTDETLMKVREAAERVLERRMMRTLIDFLPAAASDAKNNIVKAWMQVDAAQKHIELNHHKFLENLSLSPAIAQIWQEKSVAERNLASLKASKAEIESQVYQLESLMRSASALTSGAASTELLPKMESDFQKTTSAISIAAEIIEPVVAVTDECASKLGTIVEKAEHQREAGASAEPENYLESIKTTVEAHETFLQSSLDSLLKSYSNPTIDSSDEHKPHGPSAP